MKKIMPLIFSKNMIVAITLFISACGKQNPLLTDQYVHVLKDELENLRFLETDQNKPTVYCPSYLAQPSSNNELKKLCDQWVNQIYKVIMNKGDLPYKTTLEQFKDPSLWKAVQPK